MQCTSDDDDDDDDDNDDWRCSKETKVSVPTKAQLLKKTENQWLFYDWNWVPKWIICPQSHQMSLRFYQSRVLSKTMESL